MMFQATRSKRFCDDILACRRGNERRNLLTSRVSKNLVMQSFHTSAQMLQIARRIPVGAGDAPDRRLRILQIIPNYFPAVRYGGPIRSVHALSKGLVDRGHEVHVFTSSMDGADDLPQTFEVPATIDGVQVSYFPVPALRRLCWCPAMRTALLKAAPTFDVMHLHSVFRWPTWAAARVAHAVKLPYLLSPRGMLGRAVIQGKSRFAKGAWIRLIEQRTLAQSAGLHVTSELEAAEIEALGLRLPRLYCVPNGVSWPEKHLPLPEEPWTSQPYALFLSRIDWKKGLDRLIEAWKWVPDLTLIVAGNDEEGYRSKLEKIIDQHQVRSRIRFVGAIADAQKWALYENATMFVLPSYSENFGNVVAEAMAMGCPVVVTPEVGLSSLVQRSGSGVVSDGAPRAFAQAVSALLNDQSLRRRMSERGRLTARRDLSWESAASRMENIYREISEANVAARRTAA
jgi:glycosyltransferase involved in cell wall biosynthesis